MADPVQRPGAAPSPPPSPPPSPQPASPPAPAPASRAAGATTGRAIARVVAVLVLVVGAGAVAGATLMEVGTVGLVAGAALALLPVVPVVAALMWLDRYEPEPPGQLVLAFAWGAAVATLVALVVNTTFAVVVGAVDGDPRATAVVVAPVVEETVKGLGVVAVLLWRRREFDGVVDGIVYAGMVGAGFAMVENVLYLGRALVTGGVDDLVVTFVLRCVVSPFAHPLFTMAIGVGIGLAVTSRHVGVRLAAPLAGWVVAVLLHAAWNASASLPFQGFATLYVVLQLPIFAAALALALVARARQGRLIARNLGAYAGRGWFTDAEVVMLSSLHERARARAWARRTLGPAAVRSMRELQGRASELAFLRERMVRGTAPRDAVAVEADTLAVMWHLRSAVVPRAVPAGAGPGSGSSGPGRPG